VHVARTQVKKNARKIVAGRLKEQSPFGKYLRRLENYIKSGRKEI